MAKRHLLFSAAVIALAIGATAPAFAQDDTDYNPAFEPAAPAQNRIISQPPASSTPPVSRVLKPSGAAPAEQSVRSYPPASTNAPYTPAEQTTTQPYQSYPIVPAAPVQAYEPPTPQPQPQPVPEPAVAKRYQPSPSVVDDPSYKPDYSGYYKSGAPLPAAVANVETQQPTPPAPAEAPKPTAADELSAQLPEPQSTPQLDPLPNIMTERSIEQTPPPATPMQPVYSPAQTPSKIVSHPGGNITTRPMPKPAMTEVAPLPEPQRKPRPSLEIVNTPPPERPAEKPAVEAAEVIVPPTREEGKTDISKLAEQVDNAAAEMGTPPPPVEPQQFATVPTQSDLMLEFPGNSSDLTTATQRKLDAIVRQMSDLDDGGRLQVRGYAAGEDGSKSSARRIALSRALSVRSYLMDKGVKAKRVDVRAMGSETDRNPLDRVDLIFQR